MDNKTNWKVGGGIPQHVTNILKEIGATQKEFMNMLYNGDGIENGDEDIDNMTNVVLRKLRDKYTR